MNAVGTEFEASRVELYLLTKNNLNEPLWFSLVFYTSRLRYMIHLKASHCIFQREIYVGPGYISTN